MIISFTTGYIVNMLKVPIDRILSITEARSRLSELIDEATSDDFWVLTKGGKPRVAIVDVAYLDRLLRQAQSPIVLSRSDELVND